MSRADTARLITLATSVLAPADHLESSSGQGGETREVLVGALAEEIALTNGQPTPAASPLPPEHVLAAESVVATAERVLADQLAGESVAAMSDDDAACLEAIVRVSGRPAVPFVNGEVQMPRDLKANDTWRVLVAIARSSINAVAASVARLELTMPGGRSENLGTAWRVGDDLLVTNRHVLERVVRNATDPVTSWQLDTGKSLVANFGSQATASTCCFDVTRLCYCAPDEPIDVAILRANSRGGSLPPALTLEWHFTRKKIYVIGHPQQSSVSNAIARVFGTADGSKRWSPGYVTKSLTTKPVIEHDCSTLGGSSGSCVVSPDFRHEHRVVAMHYGGKRVDELTSVGAANLALPLSGLKDHPVGRMMHTGTCGS